MSVTLRSSVYAALSLLSLGSLSAANVNTVSGLVAAVNNGANGDIVTLAPGTYQLTAPLRPKAGMTIQGAGIGQSIIMGASSWSPSTVKLPDYGVSTSDIETGAYLFSLTTATHNITISDMTLTGPLLHGAIYGNDNDNLHLHHLKIDDFRWSGIRIFRNGNARIHDCEFVDAAGRWDNGSPGVSGGITGGCIYFTYMKDSEIWNNRFTKTQTGNENSVFGIKGREARTTRIHHNTINVNFAIELPFENDHTVEIDHNVCQGVISIPKHAGGPVPTGGYTFHIHHNYFNTSYAIEFVRNGVEIDHNLFDFKTTSDGGNLISGFGSAAAPGSASFHNNLVKNPGRGVYWVNEVFNNIEFRNNHVIANVTSTPRGDGMFGFNGGCDFSTITIKDNIIECIGKNRPLVRNSQSNSAKIQNNTLIGISDTGNYANPSTGAVRGLTAPLAFTCGVNDEYTVNGWNFSDTTSGTGLRVTYFDNIDFTGATVTRSEALDFNWGNGSPASGIGSDTFSVRAEGEVRAVEAGNYEFRTQADDGIRLWIGGQLVINNFVDQGPAYRTSPLIAFAAGEKKTVKVEYYENRGGAVMRLQWKRPSQSTHVAIPAEQLSAPEFQDWIAQDIGSPNPPGSATVADDQFIVRGSGADIWNSSDEFQFVHRSLSGDGVFTARVDSIQNTNSWAKAGVMIRESLAANSKHAMMIVTPDGKASFQRRVATAGSSAHDTVYGQSTPRWVRIVRSGNNFTAFHSANGTSWSQVGSTTSISMGTQVYMGLAVTSHASGTLCEAVFCSVE